MIERITLDGQGYGQMRVLGVHHITWSREAGDGLGMGDVGRMNGDGGALKDAPELLEVPSNGDGFGMGGGD